MNCNRTTGYYHDRGEVERMKRNPGNDAATLHYVQRKPEHVGAITQLAFQFEMHPAEDKWKCNQCGDNASPHDQEVHRPARESAFEDKSLANQISGDRLRGACRIL